MHRNDFTTSLPKGNLTFQQRYPRDASRASNNATFDRTLVRCSHDVIGIFGDMSSFIGCAGDKQLSTMNQISFVVSGAEAFINLDEFFF